MQTIVGGLGLAACLLLLLAAAGQAFGQASDQAPDFAAYLEVEPNSPAPGKVAGLVRNISDGPMRNIVLRVRHRWRWSGGRYDHTENATVSRLVISGDAAGFAAVHFPPDHVPEGAGYDYDVTVMQLSRIRLAPE